MCAHSEIPSTLTFCKLSSSLDGTDVGCPLNMTLFSKRVQFSFLFFLKVRFIILGQLDELSDSALDSCVMYVLFCFNVLHLLYLAVLNQVAFLLLKI